MALRLCGVHGSQGKWLTYGLEMEALEELATNLVNLAVASLVHYSCV